MSWAEVFKTNNDFANTSLDTLIHLQDYKMFGENSYVFRNKEFLHGLYECTYLSMNDEDLREEAFEYFMKENKKIGSVFAAAFGIEEKELLETLTTMKAVTESNAAMQAIAKSDIALAAIAKSEAAIKAICESSIAIEALSTSPLRKKVSPGKKAVGLILPMALGGKVYFHTKDVSGYGRIEYQDGTFQPFSGDKWVTTHTNWGDVLKAKPKAAKLVRVVSDSSTGNWIDIILIRGSITNS